MSRGRITVAVAHDEELSGSWVRDHLPAGAGIEIADLVASLSPDSTVATDSKPDVLVIACRPESDGALELVAWWTAHRSRPIVVVSAGSANGFVQRALDAGADDIVMLDPGPEASPASIENLAFALRKAVSRPEAQGQDPGSGLGTMITVLGPKGGTGKTLTACNLAVELALKRKRVVLVDLDLQFGDVALALGLRPEQTVYDLATSGGSLDAEKVDAYLVTHASGLRVLAAPVRPDHVSYVTTDFLGEVLEVIRAEADYVVVDTPPTFTPEVITAIDASTFVCMLGMLDALSLKNSRVGLETLDLMGFPSDRIRLVLNRANTSVGITGHDVTSILGRDPDVLIPSTREITRSINQGEPIVLSQKRSEAARSFELLASIFIRAATPELIVKRRGRGILRRGRV